MSALLTGIITRTQRAEVSRHTDAPRVFLIQQTMVLNFADQTHELTDVEVYLLDFVKELFMQHDEINPVKGYRICERVNVQCDREGINYRLSEPRLRKMVNYFRSNSVLPLLATSQGYYVTNNKVLIKQQIESLCQRAGSIANCASGLNNFL